VAAAKSVHIIRRYMKSDRSRQRGRKPMLR
jgi:hypothetical protein